MNRSTIFFALMLGASTLHASQSEMEVLYDPRPDHGIPRDITLQASRSATDEGPMKNVVDPDDILLIKVRYYDRTFKSIQEVQTSLASVLWSDKGSTTSYVPWAEDLPVPSVEATIYFKSMERGRLLLWPKRSAFQDKQMRWWFGQGF